VALADRYLEGDWQSEGIDDEMDLGRRAASGLPDGVELGPPFPPAAW
jgi:hypothetical protein